MILKIRQERIQRDWTQEYVAGQVGLTKQAIQLIETTQAYPSYPVLVKLEDLFNLTHRELFAAVPEEPHNLTEE